MATKRHVAFTWGKSIVESIKMSSLEFEQNGKKEDNGSKFEIVNVSEDPGTEVKDREEQDGGYFDAMMEHNTEESAESIDSFIKKATEKSEEGMESEEKHTEKNDSVEGTSMYGSEDDSSYNINEEIEKESRVMDCETADIALSDVSMGLSLHDDSEEEGDDVMVSEEMEGDGILSEKVLGDGMASDHKNDVIKSKDGDFIESDEEDYVMTHQRREDSELLTGVDIIAAESGADNVMGSKAGDGPVVGKEKGGDDLMEGEGADLEPVISDEGEGEGSLLDTEHVNREKDIKFVKISNIQIKVDVANKRVDEAADLVSVVPGESRVVGSLPDTEYLDKKQIYSKKEVDILDKILHREHSDVKDKVTKSLNQQMECTGEGKKYKVNLKGESENIDLRNEEVKGIADTKDDSDDDNPDFQYMLSSEDARYSETCTDSENGEDTRESLNKIEVLQVNILGKKEELVAATPENTTPDGEYNAKDELQENKVNERLNEEVNTAECEDEIRKHKSKTEEEARTDRGGEEDRETLGTRDNLIETVKESRNVAQVNKDKVAQTEVDKDEMTQTGVTKEEGEKVMTRSQHEDSESDQCNDVNVSLKKASRTQVNVDNETDEDVHEISDTHELASAGQQAVDGVLIKKTVSNIERVKRKIEEILEKSKTEEDEFIEEIQQMKKEKSDVLNNISSEMKKLKSLLVNEKREEQK